MTTKKKEITILDLEWLLYATAAPPTWIKQEITIRIVISFFY